MESLAVAWTLAGLLGVGPPGAVPLDARGPQSEREQADEPKPPEARSGCFLHAEMLELFVEIERTLRGVDGLLWESQGPDRRDVPPPTAGELLSAARDGARRAVERMDRLIELSGHTHELQGGGGSGGT